MKKNSESLFTFGSYIRKLRIEKDIGQRELAKKIDIAPSYLNDIENNKRAAPKNIIIKYLPVSNDDSPFFNILKVLENADWFWTEIHPFKLTKSNASLNLEYSEPITIGIPNVAGSNILCNPVLNPPPTYAVSA